MNKCDMCGFPIANGHCGCGEWKSAEEMKDNPMKLAIEEFHAMRKFTLTCDSPHLGAAVVFFRGDYADCKTVEKFIYRLKNRPYYEKD